MPASSASSIEEILRTIIREELDRALITLGTVAPSAPVRASTQSEWFNITRAAAYAGVSRQTVGDSLRSGQLVGSQQHRGAHWRVQRRDLDAWLLRGTPTLP